MKVKEVIIAFVAVFLLLGFLAGWSSLRYTFNALGEENNLREIDAACALACSTRDKGSYCNEERLVKYGDVQNAWNGEEITSVRSSPGTCERMFEASKDYPGLNVAPCRGLC